MTPKPAFTAEQAAAINDAINATGRDLRAKMRVISDAIETAFVPAVEKMRAAVRSMQEKP